MQRTQKRRAYVLLLMFSFYSSFFYISPPDLRAPSGDRRETLPHDRKYVQFYNSRPKIWGPFPEKKFDDQKRAKCGAISDNFRFQSQMYPELAEISTIEKRDSRDISVSWSLSVTSRRLPRDITCHGVSRGSQRHGIWAYANRL